MYDILVMRPEMIFVIIKSLKTLRLYIYYARCGDGHTRESKMVNRSSKSVRLHIGHLIGPNIVAWYDF